MFGSGVGNFTFIYLRLLFRRANRNICGYSIGRPVHQTLLRPQSKHFLGKYYQTAWSVSLHFLPLQTDRHVFCFSILFLKSRTIYFYLRFYLVALGGILGLSSFSRIFLEVIVQFDLTNYSDFAFSFSLLVYY